MKISILDVAKYFISAGQECGDNLTHLKLQKLCYLAEAYHLALYDAPLTGEPFQAWAHGPVSLTIWHQYKKYKWLSISEKCLPPVLPGKTDRYLEEIKNVFFGFTAYQLECIVHADTAWKKARGCLAPEASCKQIINQKDMADYYKQFIKQ